jgi:hypothetical protein
MPLVSSEYLILFEDRTEIFDDVHPFLAGIFLLQEKSTMGMNAKIRKTFVVLAAAVLLIILAAVIFILNFDLNSYKPRIEAVVSEATGMDVSIDGRINLAIFPETGVSIEDISIRSEGKDVARAKNVRVGLSLRHLLRREILVERVDLNDPSIFVIEDKEGRFNFETPGKRPREKAFTTGNIFIRGGDFLFVKEKTGARVAFVKCDLTIRNLSLGTGDMPGALSLAGNLSCREVKGKDLKIEDVKASVRMTQGTLEADPVTL